MYCMDHYWFAVTILAGWAADCLMINYPSYPCYILTPLYSLWCRYAFDMIWLYVTDDFVFITVNAKFHAGFMILYHIDSHKRYSMMNIY